jgi:hypothetical protein
VVTAVGATSGGSKLQLLDPETAAPTEIVNGGNRPAQNGYARFTPDGKKLLVTSHGFGAGGASPGLDVFDVTDAHATTGYKKVATVRSAGGATGLIVGGHFYIAPDGQRVVFQTGAVLATDKLTEHVGGGEPPGLNGGGGGPGGQPFPGGQPGAQPGVGMPPIGMPPGGQPPIGMPPGGQPNPNGAPPGRTSAEAIGPRGGMPMPAQPGVVPPGGMPNPNGVPPGAVPPGAVPPGGMPQPVPPGAVPPGGMPRPAGRG